MCSFSMFNSFIKRNNKYTLVSMICEPHERPRKHMSARRAYVATPLGFEPRITPPKGAVLPLHHGVSRFAILDRRFWIKAQSANLAGNSPKLGCIVLHGLEGAQMTVRKSRESAYV